MRVFHLIKGLGRGGAEVLLLEGLRASTNRTVEYGYGYLLPWKSALRPALESQGAAVVCLSNGRPADMLCLGVTRVARFLRQWRADVLHCHLPVAGVIGRIAARCAGIPVIYTEHNVIDRYRPLTRAANMATWPLQKMVVAVSGDVAASIHRHAPTRVPVRVVKNGISVGRYRPCADLRRAVRTQLGIDADAPVVGTVAVLRPQKDLRTWLSAARLVREREPGVRFIIVGDGPLRRELERLAGDLGLDETLRFVGLQPDVRPFLSAMDVFVSSSTFEGLPIALLEAMAMALPIVATRVGGVPEVVADGGTGFLVDAADPAQLADATVAVLCNRGLRRTMGELAVQRVAEHFSVGRMIQELEDVYRGVVTASAHVH